MNAKIELLAFAKDFDLLNPLERAMVLSEMSQTDFEQLRTVLLTAQKMEADVRPSAELRTRLLDKMASQQQPAGPGRILFMRMPVWQTAAIFLIGVAATWFLKKERVEEHLVTTIQVQNDTIWQEKIVYRDRIVWRERVMEKEKGISAPVATLPVQSDFREENLEISPAAFSTQRVGTTLGDTPELMRFFTQGGK